MSYEIPKKKLEELLDFPCDFSIKAIGLKTENLMEMVLIAASAHCERIYREKTTVTPSKGDKYLSVTIHFNADSAAQIHRLYETLSRLEAIKMCL